MKTTLLFLLLSTNMAFASQGYILQSRVCEDGQLPQDTLNNGSVSLNLDEGTFRLAGISNQGTSMSRPFVVQAKAELTDSKLILSNIQNFYAGDLAPSLDSNKIEMIRKTGTMEFFYNSNPVADGGCKKGVQMKFVFSAAPY